MAGKSTSGSGTWGVSHLSGLPVTVAYVVVIALAVIILAVLRHFFGSIRVEAGSR